ncbi:hypothetical protein GGS20DRAFT_27099 [Poronia punctata]|nr:hypothetical protein GGS20DRAFT_27099 [Poronia punctata]
MSPVSPTLSPESTGHVYPNIYRKRDTRGLMDSTLPDNEEDLARMVAELTNTTSGAINYMMQLVLSIQSLSFRLSMAEATSSTSMSTYTSSTINPVISTTEPLSSRKCGTESSSTTTSISGVITPSETDHVSTNTMGVVTSLRSSSEYITTFSPLTRTGRRSRGKITITSTSTRTITVNPGYDTPLRTINVGGLSSSADSPIMKRHDQKYYGAIPDDVHSSTSLDVGKPASKLTLTTMIRVTVTVLTTCTVHPSALQPDRPTIPSIPSWSPCFPAEGPSRFKKLYKESKMPGSHPPSRLSQLTAPSSSAAISSTLSTITASFQPAELSIPLSSSLILLKTLHVSKPSGAALGKKTDVPALTSFTTVSKRYHYSTFHHTMTYVTTAPTPRISNN